MRAIVAAALLVLPLLPLVGAQETAPDAPLLKDATDDVVLTAGVPGAAPTPLNVAGRSESIDLVALSILEVDDEFSLTLQVKKLEGNPGGRYLVDWTFRDMAYRAQLQRQTSEFGSFSQAWLMATDDPEAGRYDYIAPLAIVVDVATATLNVPIQKVFILDGKERSPNRGDVIEDVRVRAESGISGFRISGRSNEGMTGFRDAMPDGDGPAGTFSFAYGDLSVGTLALTTPDRVRVSNGGSTTFVYQATIVNKAPFEDEVDLSLAQMPEGWNGSVQSPVRVPPGGERTIAVLMSIPFEHAHGGFSSFAVNAASRKDPNSRAELRLGVLHTPIPQPAGHHSELYLHASNENSASAFRQVFPFSDGYINTASTHENEPATVQTFDTRNGAYVWQLPLNPSLRIGLDFDLERMGEIAGSVLGRSTDEATIKAEIVLTTLDESGDGDQLTIAETDSTKVKLDLQQATPFKLQVTPLEEAEYVPYQKDQNLWLVLSMQPTTSICCIQLTSATAPALNVADFKTTLPLEEYHDRLTGLGETIQDLALVADGPVEKIGRPGTVMTYAFDLRNNGPDARLNLDVAGTDAIAGVVVPAGSVQLGSGESRRVTLAVQIPGDATSGTQLEVLLFAYAQDDPSRSVIVRTLTTVSTGANATDDETGILLAARDAENDTPGLALPGIVLAVLAVALVLGRRR